MENVNERENTILRKNIELLEKGITVKKYLQLEKEFMIRGSTEIYNYFGFFVIYNELEKHFIMRVGLFGNHSTTNIDEYIQKVLRLKSDRKYLRRCFLDGLDVLKYYRIDINGYPTIEEYIERKNRYKDYEETFYKAEGIVLQRYWDLGYLHYVEINDETRKRNYHFQIIAIALLRLQRKSAILYDILNVVVSILVKAMPLFIWQLYINRSTLFIGENIIQKLLYGFFGIAGCCLSSVLWYFVFLAVFFIINLIVFKRIYKVKLKIFDWIIEKSK